MFLVGVYILCREPSICCGFVWSTFLVRAFFGSSRFAVCSVGIKKVAHSCLCMHSLLFLSSPKDKEFHSSSPGFRTHEDAGSTINTIFLMLDSEIHVAISTKNRIAASNSDHDQHRLSWALYLDCLPPSLRRLSTLIPQDTATPRWRKLRTQ